MPIQHKIILLKSSGDVNLTIDELKDHLTDGNADGIMKRMTSYSSNITRSDAYWFEF